MAASETPVMLQHAAAKRAHPDCIIFFRLGDFYEMFGDDAVVASEILELTLTSRNRGKPDEIPMAGVPHHAAHSYIARLMERGYKVALCEQMADPKTVRGIVPREVVRVITPGTWTDASAQTDALHTFLAALFVTTDRHGKPSKIGLAAVDLTTADLRAAELSDLASAISELQRLAPRELLVSGVAPAEVAGLLPRTAVREVTDPAPSSPAQEVVFQDLEAPESVRRATELVLGFARACMPGKSIPLFRVNVWNTSGALELAAGAAQHLELIEALSGDRSATLLSVIDRTKTAAGARLLRMRLLAPLTAVPEIRARLAEVRALVENDALRTGLRDRLAEVTDLERLAVRLGYGEATPRDLGLIRRGLQGAAQVAELLRERATPELRSALCWPEGIDLAPELLELLTRALVERPPTLLKDGAVFREGFDADLDRARELRTSGGEGMARIEERLKQETGITGLRVRSTRVFGWYVEVTKSNTRKVPPSWTRKQTVAGGERYTFPELDQLAHEVLDAEEAERERELELFQELVAKLAAGAARIHSLAHRLAALDVAAALADVAREYDYVEPTVDESERLELEDARHPVVERRAGRERFVPNDVRLDAGGERMWLITGPNMAGKSTFLRQTALIVVLAQMGSFVPAKRAHIGVVDKILSRLGSGDNLAGGESTFMVEMRETANILRVATRASLVIVDEIGRGTSTFDGLSIAWAVAEYLQGVVACRTLFATHYHELTRLAESSPHTTNHAALASEEGGTIVFLHRIASGAASKSYGISVARLAGLPAEVLERAQTLLEALESEPSAAKLRPAQTSAPAPKKPSELEELVLSLDLDRMNGLEALTFLHALRDRVRGRSN
ncbi:MAG: DNA mismatch repair protein MutS [Sorangiineae bacterium NIC37A_2]|jgi:DNA mismatch repair protein MutS|nr:MAG: DNA mismatch repair protein MutS [Sorangiineae bacterium NIC37A_2]